MSKSLSRQAGLTFWGLVFILGFIAIVVLFTLRAFPLYNEKFAVMSAIEAVNSHPDAGELSKSEIEKFFLRNVQVSNVRRFNSNNISDYLEVIKPEKRGDPKKIHVKYESRNVLFSDLYLLMDFDVTKPLRGNSDE